jgi:hypothetical protein
MTKSISTVAVIILGTGLALLAAKPVSAEPNDCFLGCRVLAQACVGELRGGRKECKTNCKGTVPGRGRGECMRSCARVPQAAKQDCKVIRDRCRGECDGPNACGFTCGAAARECFTIGRSAARDCRVTCRTQAEEMAAACATADDPETCLEGVAESRGACLDLCGTTQGEDLTKCGMQFSECKDVCHPPDGNEPPEENGTADDDD